MEATKKEGMMSKRIVLVSAVLLFAVSVNTFTMEVGFTNSFGGKFAFYFAGFIFLALFLIQISGNRLPKNNNSLQTDAQPTHSKSSHQHFRKVVKKTA